MFDYPAIMSDFHRANHEFNLTLMDICEEAIDSNSPSVNKMNTNISSNKWVERIRTLMDKVIAFIMEKIKKLTNSIRSIWQTSRGYEKEYRRNKSNTPLKGLKVLMYNYNDKYLDDAYLKFLNLANKLTSQSTSNDSPLATSSDVFQKYVYKEVMGKDPESGMTLSSMMAEISRTYRGKKTERIVNPSLLSLCEKKALDYMHYKRIVDNDLKGIEQKARAIKNMNVQFKISSEGSPDTTSGQKLDPKIVSNIAYLCNSFGTFAHYFFDLKFEQVFQCRSIVSKMYRFKFLS